MKTAPKAIKQYVGNLKSDKYKVIKTLIQELITPAQGSRTPPMRSTEIEAVRNDLDRNIDATLPNELNVRDWIFEEERKSDTDSDSDESFVEFMNGIGIPLEILHEPLPTGNLIINSSRLGAQLIMRWNNENRLIGYGDYGIYFEESGRITPGGDLDEEFWRGGGGGGGYDEELYYGGGGGGPPGPPGGPNRNIDIVFETPRGIRRIGFRNFIKALVIIGLSASSI